MEWFTSDQICGAGSLSGAVYVSSTHAIWALPDSLRNFGDEIVRWKTPCMFARVGDQGCSQGLDALPAQWFTGGVVDIVGAALPTPHTGSQQFTRAGNH